MMALHHSQGQTDMTSTSTKMTRSTEAETPVIALFHQWRILMDYINADDEMTDEKIEPLFKLQCSLKDAVMREPSTDARDHLAKIIVATVWATMISRMMDPTPSGPRPGR